jgi:hypothetical protein
VMGRAGLNANLEDAEVGGYFLGGGGAGATQSLILMTVTVTPVGLRL